MIPLFAPVRQNEPFQAQTLELFQKFYQGGRYILGPEVETFEAYLGTSLGYRHAVGCASGTEALVLALRALDLPPQSEVMTSAFSFVASGNAILWAGHRPRFVDIGPDYCLDCEALEAGWDESVHAIIAVDLFGQQADIRRLRRFCDQKGIYLIEDGAQSIGVPDGGAHLFTTSFYPTKNLGALGDAGAVLTQDTGLAHTVRALSRHGGLERDHYPLVGTTGRLDTLQAAFLNLKLPSLDAWTLRRKQLAARYTEGLASLSDRLVFPSDTPNHVWALYTLGVRGQRDALKNALLEGDIGVGVYYPRTLPQQPGLQKFAVGNFPMAEKAAREVLSLPLFPELSDAEQKRVIDKILAYFAGM